MRRFIRCLWLGLWCVMPAQAAEPETAAGLAALLRQAQYSQGFEARMNVFVTKANGAHPAPLKIAVIGQFSAERQRLLVRGIAPEAIREEGFAVTRQANNAVKAIKYRSGEKSAIADAQARLFDTGLVAWDMLNPWWNWGRHSLEGKDRVGGRECLRMRSIADEQNSPVREVESCIDVQAGLALRTRLFDGTHNLLRTITVEKALRKQDGSGSLAKKLNITGPVKLRTEIEVYAGDEEYLISEETFAVLDGPMPVK